MGDESETKERSYRHYKQLEAVRRGYGHIRDTIADFLSARRWDLQRPGQAKLAALELVDKLMDAGALSLYQCGVDVENSQAIDERKRRKELEQRHRELTAAKLEAREDEQRRVKARIAELEAEREQERWNEYLRRQQLEAEREELARLRGDERANHLESRAPLALPPHTEPGDDGLHDSQNNS